MKFIEMPYTVCSSEQEFQHDLQKKLIFYTASGACEDTVGLNASSKDGWKKTISFKENGTLQVPVHNVVYI